MSEIRYYAYNIPGFPISRDPPGGGTEVVHDREHVSAIEFPISRDPPEGGTLGYCR